ncbi:S-adenosyl-L-methionine-dependent methyltransferase [Endogone sp. FLAS-F59071]|nr:S-adenosyl-L-methionine-dependent methyltransferase [Endogone sp. FLAS-F59071]|eukprot:RUS17150.1 S-adenosyl-L-methionine-dependent methyltransferase [Endogone sp. FLAS-F59071]
MHVAYVTSHDPLRPTGFNIESSIFRQFSESKVVPLPSLAMTVPPYPAYPESQVPDSNQELEDYPLPPALSDVANFVWASLRPPSPDPHEPPGFRWIDGRGFKEEGNPAYCLPNDSIEADRLNKQHHDIKVMAQEMTASRPYCAKGLRNHFDLSQGNYRAPVQEMLEKGCRVLDAGCGTGIWSIEMAREYPESSFVGTDLVDMFSVSIESAPSNCEFRIGDTRKLPFADESFDYVFQRFQTLSFRETDWPCVIAELVRVTKPGGWIEFGSWKAAVRIPNYSVIKFFKMREINLDIDYILNNDAKIASLQDVQKSSLIMPLDCDSVESTTPLVTNATHVWRSLRPQMVLSLGLGYEEYDTMVAEVIKELPHYKSYWTMQFLYGRKPVEEAVVITPKVA